MTRLFWIVWTVVALVGVWLIPETIQLKAALSALVTVLGVEAAWRA